MIAHRTESPLRVLHVAPSFWPATAWGGPVFSTKALCDALAALPGIDLTVLTTDSSGPGRHERLALDANPAGFAAGYDVHYARKLVGRDVSPDLWRRLRPMMRDADVVHLTATYSFPTLPTLAAARAVTDSILGDDQLLALYQRIGNPRFPGGAWLAAPLEAAGKAWYRLRDYL